MRTTLTILAASILMGLIGCSGGESPVIPLAGDVSQSAGPAAQDAPATLPADRRVVGVRPAAGPVIQVLDPYVAAVASSQLSDEERETARQIHNRIPHGPADVHYVEPTIGRAGPELAIAPVGGFNIRNWPTRTVTYPRGQIVAMPLWFADPVETTDSKGLGDDVLAALYSPIRFAINVVGLPASALVYPIWQPTITDHTPMFPPYMSVPNSAPQPASPTSHPD